MKRRIEGLDALSKLCGKHPVIWIYVEGLGEAETIWKLGDTNTESREVWIAFTSMRLSRVTT